jgi:hypothetical protein
VHLHLQKYAINNAFKHFAMDAGFEVITCRPYFVDLFLKIFDNIGICKFYHFLKIGIKKNLKLLLFI